MYPGTFDYHAPRELPEALELLTRFEGEDAKVLAGGQSLIPLMKLRFARPDHLIDLNGIGGLGHLVERDGFLRIGALTRERDLERAGVVGHRFPALIDTATVVADPVVRNLATVGGNLAHGDPANDHPATMIALDARLIVEGPGGVRSVPAEKLFLGMFETALEDTEIVREIRVPSPVRGDGAAYEKFERQVGDFAVAGTAVSLRVEDGVATLARVVLTNVGPTPHRATAAEHLLVGRSRSDELFHAVARAAADSLDVVDDLRGTAAYRRRVATAVTGRALKRAWMRAEAGAVR